MQNINRREFLRLLGIGAVTAAAPKLIFDMGANLYRPQILGFQEATFDFGNQHGMAITVSHGGQQYRHAVRINQAQDWRGPTPEERFLMKQILLDWKQQRFG